jgi:hypothetical protein
MTTPLLKIERRPHARKYNEANIVQKNKRAADFRPLPFGLYPPPGTSPN